MVAAQKPASLRKNRDYLLLWGGQVISSAGSGISQIAFPLLILKLSGSPVQAGIVGALSSLTYLLFTLPAGALLDRWDRKKTMIICDAGRALCLISIPLALFFGYLTVIQIYIVTFVSGTLSIFFDIAELTCLPQVVTREQVSEAVARTRTTIGITDLLSPTLGGLLFTLRSLLPFLADAISYIVSVASLFFIRTPFQQQRTAKAHDLRQEIIEGLSWLWKQPLLRTMALLTAGNTFAGAGFTLIIIVIAQQQRASSAAIGLIFSIGGIGSILGAFFSGKVQKHFSFAQIIISVLWLYVILWLPLAALPSPLLLGVNTALLFFIGPFYAAAHISRRLTMTPDVLQGRVMSVSRLIGLGLTPLGQALTGFLLQYSGPRLTILLLIAVQAILALLAAVTPALREKSL